jgi:glycolate oxidase
LEEIMAAISDWLTIPEIVRSAHARLSTEIWDYSCGGAESETTLRRNRSAFDSLAFRTRILRGMARPDTSTTFLGFRLSLPVMLAPVGSIIHFDADGALAAARAAERAGTGTFVGTLSSPSMEDVRSGAQGPLFFQLYVRGGRDWIEAMVRRAERAGYSAICLTADSGAYGRRERDLHNRFFPRERGGRPNLEGLPGSTDGRAREDTQAALTWEDLAWLRSATRLPLVLKGVTTAEDAEIAVDHGVDVIYVSNHGGRQLDHGPSTIELLPEVVKAVNGRADVIVDSGFMRGTDVVKAIALGAKAVLIGKLQTWGLAAGGDAGLQRALELLKTEMTIVMTNVGVGTIADIDANCLRESTPPAPNPWPVGARPDPSAIDAALSMSAVGA